MRGRLTFPAGRRGKWVALGAWVLIVAAGAPFGAQFEDAQKNEPSSFLPGDAESVQAIEQVERFPGGDVAPAVVVYRRAGGLMRADLAAIRGDRAALNADPPPLMQPAGPPAISPDRTTALLVADIEVEGEADLLLEAAERIREVVHESRGGGLAVELTGGAGFSADAVEVFEQINGTLLLGAATLVFVLLILIYRSPIFWAIPLLAVFFAESTARALGFGIAEAGVTVNGQSAGILLVLVFGAGTDYALLLVARYREELRSHEDRHEAMALALRRAAPAILASGGTVIAGLLCLTIAEVNGTAGLGPIGAMGVALAMASMLTLLPALLVIFGRRAFWPFVPHYGDEGADATHGPWRRIGERVARRPRPVWIGTLVALGVMALGLAFHDSGLTSGNGFRGEVESVRGQELLSRAFPGGDSAPTKVVVAATRELEAVRGALAGQPEVARVGPAVRGEPGALLDVTLVPEPYTEEAFESIDDLRAVAKRAGGSDTLVGGRRPRRPTCANRSRATTA